MLYKIIIYIIGLTFSFFISGTTHSDALAVEHEVNTASAVLQNYYKEFDHAIVCGKDTAKKPVSDKELEFLIQKPKQSELLSSYYSEFLNK